MVAKTNYKFYSVGLTVRVLCWDNLIIAMSRKSLLKLVLWSHRGVFGSIARGHDFLNAFSHEGLSGHNVVTDAPLWVDHEIQGE